MPKAGKDPTKKENYRPTSLMHNECKNPHQNINKPNSIIYKKMIHHNQTGYIPRIQRIIIQCNIPY